MKPLIISRIFVSKYYIP